MDILGITFDILGITFVLLEYPWYIPEINFDYVSEARREAEGSCCESDALTC